MYVWYDSEFVCIVECVYVVYGEMMSVYGDDMESMCIEWVKVEWYECEWYVCLIRVCWVWYRVIVCASVNGDVVSLNENVTWMKW